MIDILRSNPLLLLFLVAAIGYPLGRIRVGGVSLGVAAVLFVGLGFGALHPDLKLPEVIYQLGLIIFVYTIGLSSGPGFFATIRRKGLRDNLLIGGMIIFAVLITMALARLLTLSAPTAAGMLAGSLTNTPALAGALEQIASSAPAELREQLLAEPVIGYSVTYPIGVVGTIAAIVLMQRIWKIDYAAERRSHRSINLGSAPLLNQTIRITQLAAPGQTVAALIREQGWNIVIGRVLSGQQLSLATGATRLAVGDLVSMIGTPEDLECATRYLGELSPEHLEFDQHEFDYRWIFVSKPAVMGRLLRDLHIHEQFGALVTRVRRGDVEMLAHGNTILEPGDRVRVVAQRSQMDQVTGFFGDSYRALSEIDFLTFSLGMAFGVMLGLLPIPLPGGIVIHLGFAGGPLLVALVLGALERTGPLIWTMPYSANLTLRQLGLILFLAAIGTRAGYAFLSTLTQGHGLIIFLAGATVTIGTALTTLWVGYRLLRIPMNVLTGMLAGLQTQPAVLGFALEQTESDVPNVGYATVYPLAMIAKIIVVQLLLLIL